MTRLITPYCFLVSAGCAQILGLDDPSLSPDASPAAAVLTSLELAGQSLVPSFDPTVTTYTVEAPFYFGDAIVTASADAGAIEIDGQAASSGVPTDPIDIVLGDSTIAIEVSVLGGDTARYTIEVTRGQGVLDYIKASNTDAGDSFGSAVALDGDTLVVGAPIEASATRGVNGDENNNSLDGAGAVYVFVRAGDRWSQQAYLKASNTDPDAFGVSVALDGNTLVVGANNEASTAVGVNGDETINDPIVAGFSGAAYVFVREGTVWTQQAYLKASNTDFRDSFGSSVAVDGDTAAVGAILEASDATGIDGDQTSNNTPGSGAVYVFVRSGTTWLQEAYLKASNSQADALFGAAVSLSGETLVVSAFREDGGSIGIGGDETDMTAPQSGAAYVFVRSSETWTQEAYLKASNTSEDDNFGTSLSLSADTLVVGAPGEDSQSTGVDGDQGDDMAVNSGAVYLFSRSGTTWSQEAYVKASNAEQDDGFGISVSLSDDVFAVGTRREAGATTGIDEDETNNGALEAGAAYVFQRIGTGWSQGAYVKASNTNAEDSFGIVAIDRDTLVVGAANEDSNASGIGGDAANNDALSAGAVYVYE